MVQKVKPEKRKFLDRPIKEIFSFNVDKEIDDTATRTRNAASKILNSNAWSDAEKAKFRKHFEKQGIKVEEHKSLMHKSLRNVFNGLTSDSWGIVIIIIITITLSFISTWAAFAWITLIILLLGIKIYKQRSWD